MTRTPPDSLLRPVLASFGGAPFLASDAARRCALQPPEQPSAERVAAFEAAIEDFARRHPGCLERIPRAGRTSLWRVCGPLPGAS